MQGREQRGAGLFRPQALEASRRRLWGELLLTQPPGTGAMLMLAVTFLLAAGALLARGEFTRTERVGGYLVPEGGVIGVQAPQGGLVARVLVAEGDAVAAGQRLIEIRDVRGLAGGDDAGEAALATIDARLARLARLRAAEGERLARERDVDRASLQRVRARGEALRASRARAEEELGLLERSEARVRVLAAQGHLAPQQQDGVTRERLAGERRIAALRTSALDLEEEAARLQARLNGWAARRRARLAELDDRADALRNERISTGGRVAFWLRAPRAGRIASLGVVAGETARPGRDLLTLLEPDARMTAVLLVPSRAVGFVRTGQRVRLLYDAFPFTRFGVHPGTVVGVGRSILVPAELSGPATASEPVYKVRVRPERDAIRAYGAAVPLQAGMAVEADIELEKRRLWRWLLEPLLALGARL